MRGASGAAGRSGLPGGDVGEVLVVAQGLAVRRLALLAEVAAARLLAVQRVEAHQLGELEEVGHPAGLLERLVQLRAAARDGDVLPELLAQLADASRARRAGPASLRAMPQ